MSAKDGITVRQKVAHTEQLWLHGLGVPRGSCLLRRKGTIVMLAHMTQQQRGPGGEYIILVGA